VRILAKLGLAVGIVLLLCWLRTAADRIGRPSPAAPPPARPAAVPAGPVDFEEVVQWHTRRVGLLQTRADVEAEIGPPTEQAPPSPYLDERLERVLHSSRHVGVPADREWVRWVDPNDPTRSVTVLFAGGQVFDMFRTGW
jgi:hypothetical protein